MDPNLLLVRDFAIALFIGALVGAEREHSRRHDAELLGGLRTFILIAEGGAVAAWLARVHDASWIFVGGLVAVGAVAVSGPLTRPRRQRPGMTTEVAFVVVYLLGGAVLFGHAGVAAGLAIVTALVLALKAPLHGAVQALGDDDVLAGLQLLFATVIVLPLLPRTAIDPWGALVPYDLWWLVILIASISLVGYVAVRRLGAARGNAASGFFGGLVSSTAVTLALAKRSREVPLQSRTLAVGVLLAWTTMGIRVLVEIAVVQPSMLPLMVVPVLAATVPVAAAAAVHARRATLEGAGGRPDTVDTKLRNPFSLWSGIRFAALFAVVLIAVTAAQRYAPGGGVLLVSALAGATDVDAICLSLARHAGGDLTMLTAGTGILLAVVANTAVKLGLGLMLGGPQFRRMLIAAAAGCLVGAGAGYLMLASSVA